MALWLEGTVLRIEGTALQIEGTALQIEGTALQIEGTALRLEGTALQIEGTALRLEGMIRGLVRSGIQGPIHQTGIMLTAQSPPWAALFPHPAGARGRPRGRPSGDARPN